MSWLLRATLTALRGGGRPFGEYRAIDPVSVRWAAGPLAGRGHEPAPAPDRDRPADEARGPVPGRVRAREVHGPVAAPRAEPGGRPAGPAGAG